MGRRKISDEAFLQAMRETRFIPKKDGVSAKSQSGGQKLEKIDLHGYTVERALLKLEEVLDWKSKNPGMRICLIVGQGRHSFRYTSSLREAIEDVLLQKGVPYEYKEGVVTL